MQQGLLLAGLRMSFWSISNVTRKRKNLKPEGFTDVMWKEVILFVRKKIFDLSEKIWRFQK